MEGYYKKLVAILKKYGYYYLRQGKGSHEIWGNEKVAKPVPHNSHNRHTANGILKQFGINEKL